MPDSAHLWLFCGLVFGVVVLPGMDMAFVLGSALVGGRRAGLAAVGGLIAGGLCHVAMAATGLAVVLTLHAAAFNLLLVAGALYMGWIGYGLWRSVGGLDLDGAQPLRSPTATFRRAALTNLLNPKAYVFTLAVFPQFLRPDGAPVAAQAVVLAAIITANQAVVYGAVALAADAVRGWLRAHPGASRGIARTVGAFLVLAAAFTVATGWRAA